MFAADAKTLSRIEPVVRRVLIADPNMASARLLLDIMKSLGAREVVTESDENRVMDHAREMEPGLIFTERSGARLDGEQLARRIRRSNLACRRAPIIMMTADATASSIKGARDSGIHEFLRKPFTSADLFKRVENVALKPRDWIEAVGYVGPDRRRFNSGEYAGPQKRTADKPATAAQAAVAVKDQAFRILAASLAQFDNDPMQAARAVKQQAETLKALAMKTSDARLAVAAAGLEGYLAQGAPTKAGLAAPISAILALAPPETLARAG
ncbi:response regulator [Brevundimonas subvibrioides]|uniref:Response regulator receiver n=1 Tax=Brevundimonas subvibrioides (strain ATCC 15264 / DSM 4735 / LMG 14903 / NBRC 16000 / CB 81) TaxID=633149 RepID=D9QFA3_BRESC|nr:response regulator [Brevundimonas subvibrioides]ADL00588.1 response regulator receiver [Brevundimonas subvibrioides ATCC 15264]